MIGKQCKAQFSRILDQSITYVEEVLRTQGIPVYESTLQKAEFVMDKSLSQKRRGRYPVPEMPKMYDALVKTKGETSVRLDSAIPDGMEGLKT